MTSQDLVEQVLKISSAKKEEAEVQYFVQSEIVSIK